MKFSAKLLTILFFAICTKFAFPNEGDSLCSLENAVFQDGEKVKYKVYYNWKAIWAGAGTVTFEVENSKIEGKDCFHITATGRTYKRYDWFYKVRDKYETFIDTETMLSKRFVRDVYENGFEIYNDYNFYRDSNYVISETEDTKHENSIDTFAMNDCTHDLLSAAFYTRCIDYSHFEIGDTVSFTIFLDNEFYPLYLKFLGKEVIDTKLGKFNCLKIMPLLIEGRVFSDNESMTIYITDDKNHLPVMVESPLTVGSVKALLVSYSGLRHQLESLIE